MIHELAQGLNTSLNGTIIESMLSDFGKRIYFPKGIIAQSVEAKKMGNTANATIGMSCIEKKPIILPSVQKELPNLSSAEAVAYAPTAGDLELRELWKKSLIEKNPGLENKTFSLPVVVPGLTAGISYLCDLFLSENDTLLAADPSWDNYPLIVQARRNATFTQFSMFSNGGFDIESFKAAMQNEAKKGIIKVILNFPQNPSGYSPTSDEVQKICEVIKTIAEQGTKIMVWSDDAYFGLNYENNIEPQSLFTFLADIHENVIAVKIDGPTKEDYVWGFRAGFLTFAAKGLTQEQYDALIQKLMGTIRSSVSCVATPSQSIMKKVLSNPNVKAEKEAFYKVLEERYQTVRTFLQTKENHPVLEPLPFNSGYFMSLHCKNISAESLRQKLLSEHGMGIIAINDCTIRIAFSSIDNDLITTVYEKVYAVAEEMVRD